MKNSVRTGLYARVSSTRQAQEQTIDSQVEALRDFGKTRNEPVDPDLEFLDNGVSGASLERQSLDRMRDRALRGEIDQIYVLSPDRLSRKSAHQILLIDEFKRLGVNFVFSNRNIGDTPEDQMLLQIQGVVAEYEREKIMERSRRGKLHAAKNGKVSVLGGAPFGYQYEKKSDTTEASYLIHSGEAKIVKEAFYLYCTKQVSIGEIAKIFTQKGYKTRTGLVFWERSVIWGMLRNPAYKGKAAFRKTMRVKRNRKTKLAIESKNPLKSELSSPRDRSKSDWITIPVPAIIDEKSFEIAQQRLEKNKKFSPRNNKKYEYLLSGLLRCDNCGYSIYGKPASNSKYKRLYYRCMGQDGHRWPGGRVCAGHPVRTEAIDELVWQSVKALLLEPEKTLSEYGRRAKDASSKKGIEVIRSHKKKQVRALNQEKERLIDLFQSGLIEKGDLTPRLNSNKSKTEKLIQELDFLKRESQRKEKTLTVINNLSDFIAAMHKNIEHCDFHDKQYLVRLVVEEVLVNTVKEEINVRHVIPMDPQKKCPLRPGTERSPLRYANRLL